MYNLNRHTPHSCEYYAVKALVQVWQLPDFEVISGSLGWIASCGSRGNRVKWMQDWQRWNSELKISTAQVPMLLTNPAWLFLIESQPEI